MSRAIEAAALFAVGVVTGGVVVYTARNSSPTPAPPLPPPATQKPRQSPALRKDVLAGEVMSEGSSC